MDFFVIYVREIHPADEADNSANAGFSGGVDVAQAATVDQRRAAAEQFADALNLHIPVLVDRIDDRAGADYSAVPSRMYIVAPDGSVAYKGRRAPMGPDAQAVEQALLVLLSERFAPKRHG